MRLAASVIFMLMPSLLLAAVAPAPEDLVPFEPNKMSDTPQELAGILIHTKAACLDLLQPILSPKAVISAGLKALSNPARSDLSCLNSLLESWENSALPAKNPFPNPIWKLKEESSDWNVREAHNRRLINCFNQEKPGSPAYSAYESLHTPACNGLWLKKEGYLKAKAAHEQAVDNYQRSVTELNLWKAFPRELAELLAEHEPERAQLSAILANPEVSGILDREKLFEAYAGSVCAKQSGGASNGRIIFCKGRQLAIASSPAPYEAILRSSIPDVKQFISSWKEDSQQRSEINQRKRRAHSAQLTSDYGMRRLLAKYAFAGKAKSGPPSLENFCTENEAGLRAIKAKAASIAEFKPFKSAEQWRMASDYGISELEYSGIAGYTGRFYKLINKAIWGETQAIKDSPILKQSMEMELALKSGLDHLPPYRGKPVRRFSALPKSVLAEHQVGKIITYNAYTSTSKKEDWAWGDGEVHKFLIYGGHSARDVTALSANPIEEEVLFKAGTRFKVLSRKANASGFFDFVLAEVDDAGNVIAKIPAKP